MGGRGVKFCYSLNYIYIYVWGGGCVSAAMYIHKSEEDIKSPKIKLWHL